MYSEIEGLCNGLFQKISRKGTILKIYEGYIMQNNSQPKLEVAIVIVSSVFGVN
jgi:hypothetical protein